MRSSSSNFGSASDRRLGRNSFPMEITARVTAAMQNLMGSWAEQAARESGILQRQREFSAVMLAQCFVFGFLAKPGVSEKAPAQMAGACGGEVTPQQVEQRNTPRLVAFLEALFRQAIQCVVSSDEALAPLLERFGNVLVLGSMTISLPAKFSQRFPDNECFQTTCGCLRTTRRRDGCWNGSPNSRSRSSISRFGSAPNSKSPAVCWRGACPPK